MASPETIDLTEPASARGVWWVIAALWAGGVMVYAAALHLEKVRLPFSIALREAAMFGGTLAVVMVLVHVWDRRPPRPASAWRLVADELGLGLAAIAIWQGLRLLEIRIEVGPTYWRVYEGTWLFQLLFDLTVYGTVRGLMLAASAWRRDRERERREAALMVAARDLELSVIRTQFQPHFVLNALNSLLALIDDDPALARTVVVRLADLMTAVFDRGDVREVPLERELDLLRAYLDIERIRLGARLTVRFDIDDAARGVAVPPFLLQPIVENAVKHGVAPFTRPGTIVVAARVVSDRLQVTVTDSGGRSTAGPNDLRGSTGLGLHLTRRRLETAYGRGYTLTLTHDRQSTIASVDVPASPPSRLAHDSVA